MIAIFTRTPNGDGIMQWRCRSIAHGRINHASVYAEYYPSVVVACNVKIIPSVGKFSRPPAYYM
jgi:hypothetical protein